MHKRKQPQINILRPMTFKTLKHREIFQILNVLLPMSYIFSLKPLGSLPQVLFWFTAVFFFFFQQGGQEKRAFLRRP